MWARAVFAAPEINSGVAGIQTLASVLSCFYAVAAAALTGVPGGNEPTKALSCEKYF
tara:strand:+ start:984 stop:1154 length:171 start_codon:yes stop_codon:yes gene_type:complete